MESPFDHYSDHYRDIGTLLKTARQHMHLGLEQAAQMLHIRVRYLDALEQGRLDELPGLPYAKGYLQSYAAFLQLDKDEILRRFEGVEELIGRKAFYFPQVLSKSKTPSRSMIWGGLTAILLVYVLWSVAMKPKHEDLQVVEPYAEATAKAENPPANPHDVACLKSQDVLYPPCTLKEPRYGLLPVQKSQMDSVMGLANQITDYDADSEETADAPSEPAQDEQQADGQNGQSDEQQPSQQPDEHSEQ